MMVICFMEIVQGQGEENKTKCTNLWSVQGPSHCEVDVWVKNVQNGLCRFRKKEKLKAQKGNGNPQGKIICRACYEEPRKQGGQSRGTQVERHRQEQKVAAKCVQRHTQP